MKDDSSLPACARVHPGQPSVVTVTHCVSKGGTPFDRRVCTTCKSTTALKQPRTGKRFGEQSREQLLLRNPYRVAQLNWTPPKMLKEPA